MAKRRKRKNTIDKIINNYSWVNAASLSEKDLRKMTSKLISAANKRLKRFAERGTTSPSVELVLQKRDKFSINKKNYNEVRAELNAVVNFLKSKTSTYKGAEENKLRKAQQLGLTPFLTKTGRLKKGKSLKKALKGQSLTSAIEEAKQKAEKVYSLLEKIKELDPGLYYGLGSGDSFDIITQEVEKDINIEYDTIMDRLGAAYEDITDKNYQEEQDASRFFE